MLEIIMCEQGRNRYILFVGQLGEHPQLFPFLFQPERQDYSFPIAQHLIQLEIAFSFTNVIMYTYVWQTATRGALFKKVVSDKFVLLSHLRCS